MHFLVANEIHSDLIFWNKLTLRPTWIVLFIKLKPWYSWEMLLYLDICLANYIQNLCGQQHPLAPLFKSELSAPTVQALMASTCSRWSKTTELWNGWAWLSKQNMAFSNLKLHCLSSLVLISILAVLKHQTF